MNVRGLVAAVLLLPSAGCCRLVELALEESEPPADAPATDLGIAMYPSGASSASPTMHAWYARRLVPDTYRAGYGLSPEEHKVIRDGLRAYARKVQYKDDGAGAFRWVPPPGCSRDMHCIFENLAAESRPGIEPIIEIFRKRQAAASLTSMDLATLVVSFVQSVPYEIPTNEPFGLLPPALVVAERKGDCDSKALLAHMMLDALGVDSMIVTSEGHRHSMLGIALPAQGTRFKHAGREYAFTEMTAKGSPIGHINPSLLKPNDWTAVPIRLASASSKTSPPSPSSTGTRKKPRK
jgi:hypothetical protein